MRKEKALNDVGSGMACTGSTWSADGPVQKSSTNCGNFLSGSLRSDIGIMW
jgi:hypothetical protein